MQSRSSLHFVAAGFLFCCFAAKSTAAPASIVFSAQEGVSALANSDGSNLADGSLLRFGWFDFTPSLVAANFGNVTMLNAHFHELGHGQAGFWEGYTSLNSSGAVVGRSDGWDGNVRSFFTHQVNMDPSALGLSSQQFYIWVLNSPSLNTATEQALFSDNSWIAPSFGSATFELGLANPTDISDVYLATRGPDGFGGDPGMPLNHLIVIPVPEPAAPILLSLAFLFSLTHRRRQS